MSHHQFSSVQQLSSDEHRNCASQLDSRGQTLDMQTSAALSVEASVSPSSEESFGDEPTLSGRQQQLQGRAPERTLIEKSNNRDESTLFSSSCDSDKGFLDQPSAQNDSVSDKHRSAPSENETKVASPDEAGTRIYMDEVEQRQQSGKNRKLEQQATRHSSAGEPNVTGNKLEQVKHVDLFGHKIVALTISDKDRLCLAQISNTLLKDFSYNEIHNRRVALGITCVQCTPIQLEMLRQAGAMPSSSRRCGMITMREAERLCRSFLAEEQPPELPDNFHFVVAHRVNYGCRGRFIPARYISSRAKCIECFTCGEFYSPNKFIFHSHKQPYATDCNPPDSPNINSWRKHIDLDWTQEHSQEIKYAWEDVKSLFNGGTRRRVPSGPGSVCGSAPIGLTVSSRSDRAAQMRSSSRRAADQQQQQQQQQKQQQQQQSHQDHSHQTEICDDEGGELIVDVDDVHQYDSAPSSRGEVKHVAPFGLSASERRKMPIGWPFNQKQQGTSMVSSRQQISMANRLAKSQNSALSLVGISIKRLNHTQAAQQQAAKKFVNNSCAAHKSTISDPGASSTDAQRLNQRAGLCNLTSSSQEPFNSSNLTLISANNLSKHMQQQSSLSGDVPLGTTLLQQQREQTFRQTEQNVLRVDEASQKSLNSLSGSISYAAQQNQSVASPASFIYNQLYSQLIQSQQQQQQPRPPTQPHLASIDAQLALKHQIWSNLLANLQSNTLAANACLDTKTDPISMALMQNGTQTGATYNLGPTAQEVIADTTCMRPSANQPRSCDTVTSASLQNFNLNMFPMQIYSPQTVERMFGEGETVLK